MLDFISKSWFLIWYCLGSPENAITTCISANEWSLAVELSKKYSVIINSSVEKERSKYLNNDAAALQLLYDTHNYGECADRLFELARGFWRRGEAGISKKYLVLVALCQLQASSNDGNQVANYGAWTDVVHVHFFCLGQRLYANGQLSESLSCLEMCLKSRFVDSQDVCSLKFLTALHLGRLDLMKNAMVLLSGISGGNTLDSLILSDNEKRTARYKQLLSMYNEASKHMNAQPPNSQKPLQIHRRICSVTGKPLSADQTALQCQYCKQYRLASQNAHQQEDAVCPVCHQ